MATGHLRSQIRIKFDPIRHDLRRNDVRLQARMVSKQNATRIGEGPVSFLQEKCTLLLH